MTPTALASLWPGCHLLDRRSLTGGVSATTLRLELILADGARTDVVARKDRRPDALPPATHLALLGALHQAGLPVARPLGLVDDDGPWLLAEHVTGQLEARPQVPQAEAMGALLVRIHATDPATLPTLPERPSPLAELPAWWPEPVVAAVAHTWRGGRSPTLLHGDFWPGNLLWRDGAVVAVLDWEDAAWGDPLSDLAAARVELCVAGGPEVADAFTVAWRHGAGPSGDDAALKRDLLAWDLYVAGAALDAMDGWGLPPAILEHRRAATRAFAEERLRALTRAAC